MYDFELEREGMGSFNNCTRMDAHAVRILALTRGVTGIVCFLICVVTMALMVIRRKTLVALRESTQTRLMAYLFLSTTVYLCVLGMHTEHYWNYDGSGNDTAQRHQWQIHLCEAVGMADQYTGSVQLFFTIGISAYFAYHSLRFCCYKTDTEIATKTKRAMELSLVVAALVIPALYVWVPFLAVPYGETGPWCWIRTLDRKCNRMKGALWEQMGIWYMPFGIAALTALLAIIAFLLGLCVYLPHVKKRKRQKKGEACVLIVFLSTYCTLFLIEFVSHIISVEKKKDYVSVWALYAVSTPLCVVTLPIGLLIFTYTRTLRDAVNQCCTCHCIRRAQIFIDLFRNTSSFTNVPSDYRASDAPLLCNDDGTRITRQQNNVQTRHSD